MALSRNMIIGLVVLGVLVLLGALFGTLAATGVLGGQKNKDTTTDTTIESVPGCTDTDASNYDESATEDDGSCEYLGCTDTDASNYDESAKEDDGSCVTFRSVTVDDKTYYTTVYDSGIGESQGWFRNTPAVDASPAYTTLQKYLIGDASGIGGYFLISSTGDKTFAKKIERGDNNQSANAIIKFSEDLDDADQDFVFDSTNAGDDKYFYIVKGDDDYIKNNVKTIIAIGKELKEKAGT